jgi:hypothetical protein
MTEPIPPGALRRRMLSGLSAAAAVVFLAHAAQTAGAGPRAGVPPRPLPGGPGAAVDGRLEGEYGLWVGLDGDSVRVRWITRAAVPGRFEARTGGRLLYEADTPADSVHAVAFRAPRRGEIVLRYGSATDARDRHETVIDIATGARRPGVTFPHADTLYVMGDIHGEFDTLVAVLINAGVIGPDLGWAAGRKQLVVLGDMMGRGPDVTRVLWFLYGLERQARAAGGRVHIVLGNHEIMVMTEDLRYVGEKEDRLARLHGASYGRLFDPRRSLLGRWLVSKPGMIRIGDVLLAHGGVAPAQLGWTLRTFDDSLAAFTSDDLFYHWADTTVAVVIDSAGFARRSDFFWAPHSVFWFREYAQSDTLRGGLRAVLDRFGARVHVIAHTPMPSIRQTYDGALIAVNTFPFAAELLVLVRTGDGYDRFRVGASGPPQPL